MNNPQDADNYLMTQVGEETGGYRRISAPAITSLLLAFLSPLAMLDWRLGVFGLGAVFTGVFAIRQIKGNPDAWSGMVTAICGVVLAVVVVTYSVWSAVIFEIEIESISRQTIQRFVEKLREGKLEDAYWLTVPKHQRDYFLRNKNTKLSNSYLHDYANFRDRLSKVVQQEPSTFTLELKERGKMVHAHRIYWVTDIYEVTSDDHATAIPIEARGQFRNDERYWFIARYDLNYN